MEAIEAIVLVGVLICSTVMDLKYLRIPNLCIVIGILTGLLMHIDKIGVSLAQMIIIFALMFPFFKIKGLGAGDIKLMMMLGCFFTDKKLITIFLIAFSIGAFISVIKMFISIEARDRLFYCLGFLRKIIITKTIDTYECTKTNKATIIPLALPLSIATIIGGVIL